MPIHTPLRRASRGIAALSSVAVLALACSKGPDAATAPSSSTSFSFKNAPCSAPSTVQLAVAQATRIDCSNGGTTVTLAGNGASYLVVAEFAVDQVPDAFVPYRLVSGTALAASTSRATPLASASRLGALSAIAESPFAPTGPGANQRAFSRALRTRARRLVSSGAWRASTQGSARAAMTRAAAVAAVPAVGSIRPFSVLKNADGTAFTTVNARLAYAGSDVLVYIDTLAPANGFTTAQLQAFGALFDQTLYPIDTAAFGPPSDVDQNGHIIMLMSPAVNALTPKAQCTTQGYVAGFFEEEDLGAGAADPNSNHGEIFYSIAPDPSGAASCAHTAADVGFAVPATFMHELQHLISYSQHVVIHGGLPEYGWLDEGLSLVAEELGSLYYEQKCPGTACRTNPAQIFPDSSQGFVADFLYDSYEYALLPDTASVTLHSDADDGFAWRGGDWLLMRWLGDQFGTGMLKKLDQNTLIGVPNIEAASGRSFPQLFADFGLSLVTDSLPGFPRTTAPAADRFTSRNVHQLWSRLYTTSGGTPDIPLSNPIRVFSITSDTSTSIMDPGTMSFFRLDTPSSASTVSLQFAGPGGVALPAAAKPQLAIFRLPAGL
jgi:hypothetical protein